MSKPNSLIEAVIESALERAARTARPGDVALALLAALHRIRSMVAGQAGYAAACSLDDSVRETMIERALTLFGTGAPSAVPVPARTPAAERAIAILEDAAMSCLALNAWFPGNTAMNIAVTTLASRLVDCAGGIPDWSRIFAELHTSDRDDEEAALDARWTSAAVH